jgi:hypothetical protein
VNLARRGVPAVALVSSEFWAQGDFVARSVGMPEVPRVRFAHPVAGTGAQRMRDVAAAIGPAVLDALRGRP